MPRRRLTRLLLALLAVAALGATSACGATAGEGKTVPPSTSPK